MLHQRFSLLITHLKLTLTIKINSHTASQCTANYSFLLHGPWYPGRQLTRPFPLLWQVMSLPPPDLAGQPTNLFWHSAHIAFSSLQGFWSKTLQNWFGLVKIPAGGGGAGARPPPEQAQWALLQRLGHASTISPILTTMIWRKQRISELILHFFVL